MNVEIQTERLLLRKWKDSDFAPFFNLNSDPIVMEFFPSILTREQSDALAEKLKKGVEERGWGLWAVTVVGVAEFIGFIGLAPVEFLAPFTPAVEIGWRLSKEFWGKGYASEGAKAVLKFAFETLKLLKIVSFTSVQNQRSRRVMEKIGMSHNPSHDFEHPKLPEGHSLRRHVLYEISKELT